VKRLLRHLLWEHGDCNGRRARRNRLTHEVEFVLWKAGEQGHAEDFWYPMHESHWPSFEARARGAVGEA
jgi:hypothetical protein